MVKVLILFLVSVKNGAITPAENHATAIMLKNSDRVFLWLSFRLLILFYLNIPLFSRQLKINEDYPADDEDDGEGFLQKNDRRDIFLNKFRPKETDNRGIKEN